MGKRGKWMKPSASRPRSTNIIITACVFLVGLMCWGVMMQDLYDKRMTSLRDHCRLDAVVFADELQQDFSEGESIVNGLAMSIANSKGRMMGDFDRITDYVVKRSELPIDSVQLLPGGVVHSVYPASKQSTLGFDAFATPQRKLAQQYAEQNHELIILGPTDPQSDGMALAMMMPVFLDVGSNRPQELWGFTAVYIKVSDVFSRTVTNMDKSDLAYRLEKTGFSYNDYATILESDVAPVDPVSYTFSYGGCQWRMQLAPREGWKVMGSFGAAAALGFMALLMLTALTYILLFMHDRQRGLRQMAMTDQLTGMLNRHGLEAVIKAKLNNGQLHQALFVQLDIDDFKLINDIYGHQVGDEALRHLAIIMRVFFPREAVLARNGGDEFIIVLPTDDLAAAERIVRDFVSLKKEFNYQQTVYHYTISMGYAVYSADRADGKSPLDVLRDADTALYTVKLHGKNGCRRYAPGMTAARRVQMGFSLRDVVFNLPASILIYDAEGEDILFANEELISLFECDDLDDFLHYTKHSFRGIVHPDDYERVNTSIWQQIYVCTNRHDKENDAVNYRIITKRGRVRWVIDRGRLVQSERYGRIFYVILIPDEQMDAMHAPSDRTDG